jgi:hypothetical protein
VGDYYLDVAHPTPFGLIPVVHDGIWGFGCMGRHAGLDDMPGCHDGLVVPAREMEKAEITINTEKRIILFVQYNFLDIRF